MDFARGNFQMEATKKFFTKKRQGTLLAIDTVEEPIRLSESDVEAARE